MDGRSQALKIWKTQLSSIEGWQEEQTLHKWCRGLSSPVGGGLIHWQGHRGMTRSPCSLVKDPTTRTSCLRDPTGIYGKSLGPTITLSPADGPTVWPKPEFKNTEFDLAVPLKLWSQGQCLCVGFDDGSSSLCCGRKSASSPNVGLKIAKALNVWLALAVSLGSLGSEHIAHNPLQMQSFIIWLRVFTACLLLAPSITLENMWMMEGTGRRI